MSIHKFGEIRDYLHHQVEDRFRIELTVYPRRELRFRPRSSTDGLPIVRVSSSMLEATLLRDHSEAWRRYLSDGVIEGLQAAMAEAADGGGANSFDGLLDDDLSDEESNIAEPGEEEDPAQMYEPLPGFEHFSD